MIKLIRIGLILALALAVVSASLVFAPPIYKVEAQKLGGGISGNSTIEPIKEPPILAYPVLPDIDKSGADLQYYRSDFPPGLRYSKGWYGTFEFAPVASEILLFDDVNGVCVFSMDTKQEPRGEQGGTSFKPLTKEDADSLIKSYDLQKSFEPVDAEITAVMDSEDYFNGVWAGAKLEQRWTANITLEKPTILTPRQQQFLADKAQAKLTKQPFDFRKYDPNRYWIANGGNWSDNTNHWSTSSGGSGGASLPTSADSVYFDANSFSSGSQTVTIDATANCLNMDWTGATNSPTFATAGFTVWIYGSITLNSNMTATGGGGYSWYLEGNTGTYTLDFKGITTTVGIMINTQSGTGTYNLSSDMIITYLRLYSNSNIVINTNNYNITATSSTGIDDAGLTGGTKTWNLGSSVITTTKWAWNTTSGSELSINAGTSIINCSGNFNGVGQTYNIVNLTGATSTISGSNTFSTLSLASGTTQTITFTAGTTQTVTTPNLSGSAGHVHTLQSSSAGNPWTITKAGGGTFSGDYIAVTDSVGSPGSTWVYGSHGSGDSYSNAHGWAASFVSSPTITLSPATSIEATTATLNGNITATGGENPTVTVYWGDNDGVQTPGNWDNSSAPTSPSQPQGVASYYFNATGLPTGTTIYFSAKATNSAGTSWPAASLSFLTKPAAPTGVSATDGTYTANVTVTWNAVTGASSYVVFRDSTSLGSATSPFADTGASAGTITPGTATATDGSSTSQVTLTVSGASTNNGTSYSYKVRAINATGNSTDSSTDAGYRGIGSLTYQWKVSAADSDASYSNIGTTNPYSYTSAPAPTITVGTVTASDGTSSTAVVLTDSGMAGNSGAGRYYYATLSASGASDADTTHDRGYIGIGSLTYQWERSAADSDAAYSTLGGATTNPYSDTTGVITPDGRWYRVVVSATGATPQTSTGNRGYRSFVVLAPINFTATASGNNIILVWDNLSTNASIYQGIKSYPTSRTDGSLVYLGGNETYTLVNANTDDTLYFSAWGEDSGVYSTDYTTANSGGYGIMMIPLLVIAGITALAYWQRIPFLYIISGFALLLFAFFAWGTLPNWLNFFLGAAGLFTFFRLVRA